MLDLNTRLDIAEKRISKQEDKPKKKKQVVPQGSKTMRYFKMRT